MYRTKKNKGFTLLEVIIVIIIIGVLASLALPRFLNTVEQSRAAEAFQSMSALRGSMERCNLQTSNTFVGCTLGTLDVADPSTAPNTHFTYTITGQTATQYTITATRNAFDGGNGTSRVILAYDGAAIPPAPAITRTCDAPFSCR